MLKRLLLLVLALFASAIAVQGTDFYSVYDFSYTAAPAASVYVTGNECTSADCSTVGTRTTQVYTSGALSCWQNYQDESQFNTCMAGYAVANGVVPGTRAIVKHTIPSSFGYADFFFTSGDSYLPNYFHTTHYDCSSSSFCFDASPIAINFEKKANAIAEIGQLNIVNTDNKLLPVQVQVPVSIDETVCSAFRFTQPNMYHPEPISGYSDYNANTKISLSISNTNTNVQYSSQSIDLPIRADLCAGLAAFTWTPSASLVNTPVTFTVQTQVIDNQVVQPSLIDTTSAFETVYPSNLTGTCWARMSDFTLSNVNSLTLTPSVAQITVGESLFSLLQAGAYRDNTITPMSFNVQLFLNGTQALSNTYNSQTNLQLISQDLRAAIYSFPAGTYTVRAVVTPVGSGCTISTPVAQTQQLTILAPETYTATFNVKNEQFNNVNGANIALQLLTADDHYQNQPTYSQSRVTDANGNTAFATLVAGTYRYVVSFNGQQTVVGTEHIASNMNIYVILHGQNVAPTVDLPTNATSYYADPVVLNLQNYVTDYNDGFANLTITPEVISGMATASKVGTNLVVSTTAPQTVVVRVTAQDPSGAIGRDEMTIYFNNNRAPVINKFVAEPTNGDAPFNTHFRVSVTDADAADVLRCNLNFGDGTPELDNVLCNYLDYTAHTYTLPGTYVARLTAMDGTATPVIAYANVFVFNRTTVAPHIDFFNYQSSNGIFVPTDLVFTWSVSHPTNLPMNCTLRIVEANATFGHNVPIACVGSYSINNYNITGTSKFGLIARDSNGTEVMQQLLLTLYNKDQVVLTTVNTKLDVAGVIVPGKFDFTISTTNESLAERLISVKPTIICSGVRNELRGQSLLSQSAVSKKDGKVTSFVFTTNTNDYNVLVPVNTACTFEVKLADDIGSQLTLQRAGIVFQYAVEESKFTSVRGKGTDIANYMTTALTSLNKGYNTFAFELTNNEAKSKSIIISVSSTELGIDLKDVITLNAGQTREVQLPVFVDSSIATGKYPMRVSVYDGTDKQVRYSTIIVNNDQE